jgi:hypothetical protein
LESSNYNLLQEILTGRVNGDEATVKERREKKTGGLDVSV